MNQIDQNLAALADPTRRAILARLATSEATVAEIAAPFSISQPAVSQHLKVLESAGLIQRRIDGQRRPCRLAPNAFGPIQEWLDTITSTMERNYSRLDQVLASNPEEPTQ
ncbi:ArsR/SmtB family transcription factor [Halovulum sp. GXIMD14793]